MRRLPIVLGLIVVVVCVSAVTVLACGDKLLVLGRGVRFQQAYTAVHPAAILVYARQNSMVPLAISDPQLQPALKQAGHTLVVVEDFSHLEQALRNGRYDLVLADLADAEGVEKQAQSAPSQPLVLPVVYKPTKDEAAAAGKQHQCVMKAPNKAGHYLATIDEAMELKLKGSAAKCRRMA